MTEDTGTARSAPIGAGIRVRGLRVAFDRPVLEGLDLDVKGGEVVALLGRSGSGKSTLLRVLAGLIPAQAGTVELAPPAIVFQEPRLLPWLPVWRNVTLGLPDPGGRAARELARSRLAEVGLEDRAGSWPRELSGGQAHRVALARAIARTPGVLLLDEPFAALDALTRREMHGLLLDVQREHQQSVLLVTHDVSEAAQLADRALVLTDGRISTHRHLPELTDPQTTLLADLGVAPPSP